MKLAKVIAVWLFCALLCALYLAAGIAKVGGAARQVEAFRAWGMSEGFRVFIGLAEIAGGVALLVPLLATWAALGLACIMVGAMYVHVMHTSLEQAVPTAVCFALLLFIAHARRPQALFLAK